MKSLLYFKILTCPYCKAADGWLEELYQENPAYRDIPIRVVDEKAEAAFAETYDYYYVPCFFEGKNKLHEGAADKEKIRAVLDACL